MSPSSAAPRGHDSLPQALQQLDPPSRAVLDLAFRHGMSPDEIAAVAGIDAGTVVELRDAALMQLAAATGLAGADEAGKVRAMLAGPPPQAPSPNGAAAPRIERGSRRSMLGAGTAVAVILAIVLPLTLGGGHRAAATRRPSAPMPAPAPPPAPANAAAPAPAPPPRPTVSLHPLPGSPRTAHAVARLSAAGRRLTLTTGGLPRFAPGSYLVWLYNSPRDAVQIGRFPGGGATLRLVLPRDYRRFRSLRIMRNRWWRRIHPRKSVLIAPVKALG